MFTSFFCVTHWQVVNLEDIIAERDACGVGFIASLKNEGSHSIVEAALTALGCMEHRGGCGADNDSGDGAGLMTTIPWQLLNRWFKENGLPPLDESHTGVGMVFLSKDESLAAAAKAGSLPELTPEFPFYFLATFTSLSNS
jgi:glutamate synthase (ferredoxin)